MVFLGLLGNFKYLFYLLVLLVLFGTFWYYCSFLVVSVLLEFFVVVFLVLYYLCTLKYKKVHKSTKKRTKIQKYKVYQKQKCWWMMDDGWWIMYGGWSVNEMALWQSLGCLLYELLYKIIYILHWSILSLTVFMLKPLEKFLTYVFVAVCMKRPQEIFFSEGGLGVLFVISLFKKFFLSSKFFF